MFARLGTTMATRRTRHVVSTLSKLLLVVLLLVCTCLGCTLATAAASPSALESQGSGEVASGWLATLLMSLAAGLATGIGGAAAVVLGRSPGPTAMARSLAFAGGELVTRCAQPSFTSLGAPRVLHLTHYAPPTIPHSPCQESC